MSDKLVVYYSRKNTTKTAAKKLAEELDCDIAEIISRKKFRGPLGWLAGGRMSIREQPVDITEPDVNLADYEMVILCGPVWASNITPPVRTWLMNNKGKYKAISYLLTFSASGQDKALAKLEELGGKPVKTVHFSDFERKSDQWTEKLTAFANEL